MLRWITLILALALVLLALLPWPSFGKSGEGTASPGGAPPSKLAAQTNSGRTREPTPSTTSILRVIVAQRGNSLPVSGVRVLLLPPLERGTWTHRDGRASLDQTISAATQQVSRETSGKSQFEDLFNSPKRPRESRAVASRFTHPSWRSYAWSRVSDSKGHIDFTDLPPGKYRLRVEDAGCFEFSARSSPLSPSVKKSGKKTRLRFDRAQMDLESLRDGRLSAEIPVGQSRNVATHLWQHVAASISGETDTAWDRVYVRLSKVDGMHQWQVTETRQSGRFEFKDLRPGDWYILSAQMERDRQFHVFEQRFSLAQGQHVEFGTIRSRRTERPWILSPSVVDTRGRAVAPESVFKSTPHIWVRLRSRRPDAGGDFEVPFGHSISIHGMSTPTITGTQVRGKILDSWRIATTRERVDAARGTVEFQTVVDRRRARKPIEFALVPPRDLRFSLAVSVRIVAAASGQKLASFVLDPKAASTTCLLTPGDLVAIRLRASGDSGLRSSAISASERWIRNVTVTEKMRIQDSGTQDQAGLVRR